MIVTLPDWAVLGATTPADAATLDLETVSVVTEALDGVAIKVKIATVAAMIGAARAWVRVICVFLISLVPVMDWI
ncbi:MAG: hypothetical protein AAF367_20160 [Pseudomonadota bacterium]